MNSILGKYTSYNTIIHKIDARIKFFVLILLMVSIFLPFGNYTNRFIILGIISIVLFLIMIIGKVSFLQFLKTIKNMWMMVLFLVIFMFFIPSEGNYPLFSFSNGYTLYYDGLLQIGHILLRLILMIALTIILTSTTSPMEITFAIEWYLTPLKLFKFPIQVISLTISLALRFIPTLLNESNRIMNAQKSRGVAYNRGFISSKIRSLSTLIVPLLVSCFSRSDELATAMDARGYDPYKKRSRYKVLKFHIYDLIFFLLSIIFVGLIISFSIYSSSVEGWDDIIKLIFGVKTI